MNSINSIIHFRGLIISDKILIYTLRYFETTRHMKDHRPVILKINLMMSFKSCFIIV